MTTTIKYAVMAGGGHTFFSTLGAIQELEKEDIWNIENIKNIYATSAGAAVSVICCLKFDNWEIVNDYFIKRPWHDAFPIHIGRILDAYSKRGIFDKSFIYTVFKPLFLAKDIPLDITMQQFYEFSNIELHFYSVEIYEFETIDISHKTHPNLELLTAVYMTSAIPVMFSPCTLDDKCYVDGGLITNYPLKYCIDHVSSQEHASLDEIISFKNSYEREENHKITETSTIVDFIICFIHKILGSVSTTAKQQKIKNEIVHHTTKVSLSYSKDVVYSQEVREELLEKGKVSALTFLAAREEPVLMST